MKYVLPITIIALTILFVTIGTLHPGQLVAIGEASGASESAATVADTPEDAIASLLKNVQARKWDAAYSYLASGNVDQAAFTRDLAGSDGSLRTFSGLESWELRPLRANNQQADVRATLRWSTPVGAMRDVRDLKLVRQQGLWKIVWPTPQFPVVPAQVIPVNYLRWDLVSSTTADDWGDRNLDAPHVRIVSMNAVPYLDGSVVMGEVVNEDTVPAFVNVNATLVGENGKPLGEESSFDKISHVLLPKQVTPYRIDFQRVALSSVKKVNMDVKATLVPASADPVIGVVGQAIETDAAGKKILRGQLLSQSGQIVNVPHVIATFYDNSGRVIWVSDGYVDRALYPQSPEPFSLEVPGNIAASVQNYHVVVNQYSLSSRQ